MPMIVAAETDISMGIVKAIENDAASPKRPALPSARTARDVYGVDRSATAYNQATAVPAVRQRLWLSCHQFRIFGTTDRLAHAMGNNASMYVALSATNTRSGSSFVLRTTIVR